MDGLCIFAHQDDEFGIAPVLAHDVRRGRTIHCVYLTDGSGTANPEVRDRESIRALTSLGIDPKNIYFLSDEQGRICDLSLARNIDRAWDLMVNWTHMAVERGINISWLYCLSWEGGQPDHDAAHLIALRLASTLGLLNATWMFSLYNGYRRHRRTLTPIPRRTEVSYEQIRWAEIWRFGSFCRYYPSQLTTWRGLFPRALVRLLLSRNIVLQKVDPALIRNRPHDGALLYERRFGIRFEDFAASTARFSEALLKPSSPGVPHISR